MSTPRRKHGPRIGSHDPDPDKRGAVLVYIRPSIKQQVDHARGKLTRSEWIELAILAKLERDKQP